MLCNPAAYSINKRMFPQGGRFPSNTCLHADGSHSTYVLSRQSVTQLIYALLANTDCHATLSRFSVTHSTNINLVKLSSHSSVTHMTNIPLVKLLPHYSTISRQPYSREICEPEEISMLEMVDNSPSFLWNFISTATPHQSDPSGRIERNVVPNILHQIEKNSIIL